MGIIYGNYEILEELPSWSSGVVYRAKNRNSGDIAAIKIMDMSTVQTADREDFYEKAAQSIPLEHRNIARIIDVCKRIDNSLLNPEERQIECAYVVQEFVQGISLNKVIKKQGPFLPQLGFYLLQQLAEAMVYAYSKGVPHRNLTMANIILMRDGSIKLADHGIGRLFSTGTVYYMSPEDISGHEVTEKSEIFTAGIILFEILLGEQPFEGDDFADLMNKIAAGSFNEELMETIPDFMRSVIIKCLKQNPDERYASFQELLDEVIHVQGAQELYAFAGPIDSTVKADKIEPSESEPEKEQAVRKPDEPVDEQPVSQAPVSLVEKLKAALAAKEEERRKQTEAEQEQITEQEPEEKQAEEEAEEPAEEQTEPESEQAEVPEETADESEEDQTEVPEETDKETEITEESQTPEEEVAPAETASSAEQPEDERAKTVAQSVNDLFAQGESSSEIDEDETLEEEPEDAEGDDSDAPAKRDSITEEMKMMIPGYMPGDETEDPSEDTQEAGADAEPESEEETPAVETFDDDDSGFGDMIADDLTEMEKDDFLSTAEFLRKKTETEAEIEAQSQSETGGFSKEALLGEPQNEHIDNSPAPVFSSEESPVEVEEEPQQQIDDPFIQMLSEVPMFKELGAEYLMKFRNVIKTRNFTDGHRIIEFGQPGEFLYILLDGRVAVLQEDADGNEIELTELGEGDCFGEMSLLTGDPCSATIRSKDSTTLLSLNKDDFQVMLAENAKISAHFNKILIQRLRKTNLKFENEIEKGMVGKLEMISLTELIQTIMLGQKTGKLHVTRKTDEAVIYFVNGNATYCKHGDLLGERAFYGILEWDEGTFKFAQGTDTTIADNIGIDTNGLLMEGSRRMDESSRLTEYIGSLDKVFTIEGEILRNLGMLELTDEAQSIAKLFNGQRTVAQIIDMNDDFELESLESVIELYTKDLLTEM